MSRSLFLFLLCFSLPIWAGPAIPETETALYGRVKTMLDGKPNHMEQTLKRLGNRTIEVETFISGEAEASMASQILGKPESYGKWALSGINDNPRGGSYRLQVHSLTPSEDDSHKIAAKFHVTLPIFTKQMERLFHVSFRQSGPVSIVSAKTLPHPDASIEEALLSLELFPVENGRVWIHISARVKLRSWLFYEALPEALLKKETGERARIVLDNYDHEALRLKSNQSPKEKTAGAAALLASPQK